MRSRTCIRKNYCSLGDACANHVLPGDNVVAGKRRHIVPESAAITGYSRTHARGGGGGGGGLYYSLRLYMYMYHMTSSHTCAYEHTQIP